jgi:hypothetical protein
VTLLTGSTPRAMAGEVRVSESQRDLDSSFLGSMLGPLTVRAPFVQTTFSYAFPAHSVTGIAIPLAAPVPR